MMGVCLDGHSRRVNPFHGLILQFEHIELCCMPWNDQTHMQKPFYNVGFFFFLGECYLIGRCVQPLKIV